MRCYRRLARSRGRLIDVPTDGEGRDGDALRALFVRPVDEEEVDALAQELPALQGRPHAGS